MPQAGEPQHPDHKAITIRTTARRASRLLDFDPAKSAYGVEVTVAVEDAPALIAAARARRDAHAAAAREIGLLLRELSRALAVLPESGAADRDTPVPRSSRPLTPREREVLTALSRGDSYAEIARDLHLDMETVRSHARGVRRKLGVATSRELRGWLGPS